MDIEFMKAIKKLSAQIVQATSVEIDKDKCKCSLFGWVLQKHHFIPIETKEKKSYENTQNDLKNSKVTILSVQL